MMELNFLKASRKFPGQIVFKNLDLHIPSGSRWAILGGNGSGKSTFLKTAFGALSLSSGKVEYRLNNQAISPQEAALKISYAAPYFELIEELGTLEFLERYRAFRPLRSTATPEYILEKTFLSEAKYKKIRNLSSGMKQRLRLGLALFSQADLVILDEPGSNLDRDGLKWYQDILKQEIGERTLLIGTNYNDDEAFLCDQQIQVSDYQ
jgi:ABC-type multidrug transport system ATPase subunit